MPACMCLAAVEATIVVENIACCWLCTTPVLLSLRVVRWLHTQCDAGSESHCSCCWF
jgi:hypothetical protein